MTTRTEQTGQLATTYDVVVIGGGAAGLSGALMLARSRRSVAVIDSGSPRNAAAAAVHGLLGHDGVAPTELLRRGRAEVRSYGGQVITGEVTTTGRDDESLVVGLADGQTTRARRLLITAGVVDERPAVAGLAELWGTDVVHCPYCHGWEVRDRAIGVLASSPQAMHQALLFRQLSDDVMVFANGTVFDDEQRGTLAALGIPLVEGAVEAVVLDGGRVTALRVDGGRTIDRAVIAVQTRLRPRMDFLAGLGLQPVEHPMGIGAYLPVEFPGRTAVPGVFAAGNVSEPMLQVGASAAAGAAAGATINMDLVTEDTERVVSRLAC